MTLSRVEIGSNPEIIIIKRKDISLDRKFSKLFDGICFHSVSVDQKKVGALIEIFYYFENKFKKSSTKFTREPSNLLLLLKMPFRATLISMVDPLSPIYSELQRLQICEFIQFYVSSA